MELNDLNKDTGLRSDKETCQCTVCFKDLSAGRMSSRRLTPRTQKERESTESIQQIVLEDIANKNEITRTSHIFSEKGFSTMLSHTHFDILIASLLKLCSQIDRYGRKKKDINMHFLLPRVCKMSRMRAWKAVKNSSCCFTLMMILWKEYGFTIKQLHVVVGD